MDFEKVCTIFTMQEPYYGILLSAMDRFPTKETKTIGVRRSGNVFRLGYNPDFIEDKDEWYIRESGVDFDYVEETARYNVFDLCKEAFATYSEDDVETAVDELFDLDLTEEEIIKEVGNYLKENCEEEVLN